MNSLYRLTILGLAILISSCSSSDSTLPVNQIGNASDGTEDELPIDPDILPRHDVREITEIYPYRPNSPYASVLAQCTQVENSDNACNLTSLPFVAQDTQSVTRDDIMNRLLVTHPWMGERFESLLNDAPDNMLPLFGSITAIAIGSTVRPSYYWGGTGAIHLDPAGLWLSLEEKSNIAVAEDFRSDFGNELQFWFFESMRLGSQGVNKYYSLTDKTERSYGDIQLPIYRLLYHELAHAVDYLPLQSIPTLDGSLTPAAALIKNDIFFLSPQLVNAIPLNSEPLYNVGKVSFQGETATELVKSYTPAFLGNELEADGAAKLYAYSSIREDFSTAFTLAMMKMNFDVDLYMAFVNKPADLDNYDCSHLLVGWGQKNRLADPIVQARAKWAVDNIYGTNVDTDSFFATGLGQAQAMVNGVNWCTNRDGNLLADFPGVATQANTLNSVNRESKNAETEFQQLLFERKTRIH